jgi:hypothetical protein
MAAINRILAGLGLGAAITAGALAPVQSFAADDIIKVGVLPSLSGTMAISETTLKDTVPFLIDEQNKKGGLLGKQLEPVVVQPVAARGGRDTTRILTAALASAPDELNPVMQSFVDAQAGDRAAWDALQNVCCGLSLSSLLLPADDDLAGGAISRLLP